MNNLFGDLGIFSGMMPVMDEKEKSPKKKENASKPAKKVEEDKYKGPLKLLFDSISSIEIEEEREFTKTELFEKIDKIKELDLFKKSKEEFSVRKIKEGIYHIRPVLKAKYAKGDSGRAVLIQNLLEVKEIMGEKEEAYTAELIIQKIKELYKVDAELYLIGETYIPVPIKKADSIENIKFPLNITSLTMMGQLIEFTREDCSEFEETKEEQESLIPDNTNSDSKISEKTVIKMLSSLFPDYADTLSFGYDSKENVLQVMHKGLDESSTLQKASVKKEETYPSNATVSLIFTKYELTPELFNGKKEITKKEILNYIRKLGYIEYSPERTEIQYEKKDNLIIPLIKSAKRGYFLEDTSEYRKEDTELMYICARKSPFSNEEEQFEYHLPKIPFRLFKEIIYFFWDVYIFKGTEAAAQIFYNRVEEEYEIYIPYQSVTTSHVTFERDPRRETDPNLILAVEIHSHGRYMAFWSDEDNREEVAHRIYTVIGDLEYFRYDKNHIRTRGATGGYHVVISPDVIFEFPKEVDDYHEAMNRINFTNKY